jgi:NADH:ubiquinone oxidoreductase subunit F (NADH-binding)
MSELEVTRLLAGWRAGAPLSLPEHTAAYGRLARSAAGPGLIESVKRSGLRGRGGAGFPCGLKLEAVARAGRRPLVVVNGCESEPASGKDRLLLEQLPHLVLDGAALAAGAVGASRAVVCLSEQDGVAIDAVSNALAERPDRRGFRVSVLPERYVSSEESALVRHLDGGPALPAYVPPRPFERGILIQNAETLAHVALIARRGADWFRAVGTPEDPGTTLLTVSGAVRDPGVYEVALGTPLGSVLATAAPTTAPRAILLGGYFGNWMTAREATGLPLAHHGLRTRGAALGCGVVVVLGEDACGICESAAVLDYLASQAAGQCGPCTFGLRAIADGLAALADGAAAAGTLDRLRRWAGDVEGRGACHHPDGAVRLLRSALDVFAGEAAQHARGVRCESRRRPGLLSVPAVAV